MQLAKQARPFPQQNQTRREFLRKAVRAGVALFGLPLVESCFGLFSNRETTTTYTTHIFLKNKNRIARDTIYAAVESTTTDASGYVASSWATEAEPLWKSADITLLFDALKKESLDYVTARVCQNYAGCDEELKKVVLMVGDHFSEVFFYAIVPVLSARCLTVVDYPRPSKKRIKDSFCVTEDTEKKGARFVRSIPFMTTREWDLIYHYKSPPTNFTMVVTPFLEIVVAAKNLYGYDEKGRLRPAMVVVVTEEKAGALQKFKELTKITPTFRVSWKDENFASILIFLEKSLWKPVLFYNKTTEKIVLYDEGRVVKEFKIPLLSDPYVLETQAE
ncbi:MAG: hypothetical protein QXG98_04540 [Candidatus Micrarchaeia archaeon]